MLTNVVEAAIARYTEAGTKNMRTIGIAHKGGAHTRGLYVPIYWYIDTNTIYTNNGPNYFFLWN